MRRKFPYRGSYGLPSLRYGPQFGSVMHDLLSPRFRRLVEQKFDMDLSPYPPGHRDDGQYDRQLQREATLTPIRSTRSSLCCWGSAASGLTSAAGSRVLRSADRDDYAFEFPPEFGKMLMFRVCDHSWHGFLPQKGQRMSLQLCWVDSEAYVRREYCRHSLSAFAKSNPIMRKVLEWAPRKLF